MFYELLIIHGTGTESILHIYIAFIWGKLKTILHAVKPVLCDRPREQRNMVT